MARRFGFRQRRFGRMVRRARPIVRAASGITLSKRVIFDSLTIPDVTSANYDNPLQIGLLNCTEGGQEEKQESDGTNIATTPLYSRITGFKFNFYVKAAAATDIRWILHKLPDGEELVTDANRLAGNFHNSDDTNPMREFRKMIIAKGFFGLSASSLQTRFPIFVKRKALARISPLREGDILRLDVAKHADGTTATLNGFGTIYVRANA